MKFTAPDGSTYVFDGTPTQADLDSIVAYHEAKVGGTPKKPLDLLDQINGAQKIKPKPEPTFGQKVLGGAEAVAAGLSGLVSAPIGAFDAAGKAVGKMVGGHGIKASLDEAQADFENTSRRFTYEPSTDTSKQYARDYLDPIMANAMALGPVMHPLLSEYPAQMAKKPWAGVTARDRMESPKIEEPVKEPTPTEHIDNIMLKYEKDMQAPQYGLGGKVAKHADQEGKRQKTGLTQEQFDAEMRALEENLGKMETDLIDAQTPISPFKVQETPPELTLSPEMLDSIFKDRPLQMTKEPIRPPEPQLVENVQPEGMPFDIIDPKAKPIEKAVESPEVQKNLGRLAEETNEFKAADEAITNHVEIGPEIQQMRAQAASDLYRTNTLLQQETKKAMESGRLELAKDTGETVREPYKVEPDPEPPGVYDQMRKGTKNRLRSANNIPEQNRRFKARQAALKAKQGGAINPEVFVEGFTKVKDLAERGLKLTAKYIGDNQLVISASDIRGNKLAGAVFEPTNKYDAPSQINLASKMTGSSQKGLAAEIYRFASELGNDIVPSGTRTNGGKAMWNSFERDGLSQNNKIFGKSQRGSWTPFASSKPGLNKIPGIKDRLRHMMDPESMFYDDVRQRLLRATDISSGDIRNNLMSGGQMMIQFFKNDLTTWSIGMIKTHAEQARIAVRTMENGIKNSIRAARKFGGNRELEGVMQALANGVELPATASKFSRGLYDTVRKAYDETYQSVNTEYKRITGKDLYHRENYFNHSWNGPWGFEVRLKGVDSDNLVYLVREKTRGGAKAAFKWINENLDTSNYTVSKVRYDEKFTNATLKQDPYFEESMRQLMAMAAEKNPNIAEAQRHFRDHFKVQTGVGGFLGNKPWKTSHENMVDGLDSMYRYINSANNWAAAQKAKTELAKFMSDTAVDAPNAKLLAKQYYDSAFGHQQNSLKIVDNLTEGAAKIAGLSRSSIYSAVRNNKAFMTLLTLAYNVRFLGTQFAQPVLSVIPKMMEMGFRAGESSNLVANFMLGMLDSGTRGHLTAESKMLWDYAKKNYIVDPKMMENLDSLSLNNRAWEAISNNLSFLNKHVEIYTRFWAFSSFYRSAKTLGMTTKDALNIAKNNVESSMVSYELADRPKIYTSTGMVGELASNLQTYKHNQWTALIDYGKQAAKEGNFGSFAATVIPQLFFGGLLGFYGIQEMDKVFEGIKYLDMKFNEGKMFGNTPSITEYIVKEAPGLAYGGLSAMTGYDLSGSFSAAAVLPDSVGDAVFPLASKEIDMIRSGIGVLTDPSNKEAWGVFLMKTVPAVFKKPVAENLLYNEQADTYINPSVDKRNRIAKKDHPTQADYIAMSLGSRSLEDAKRSALQYEDMKGEKRVKDLSNEIETSMAYTIASKLPENATQEDMMKVLEALDEGDRRKFIQYAKMNDGDVEPILSAALKMAKNRSTANLFEQKSIGDAGPSRQKRFVDRFGDMR